MADNLHPAPTALRALSDHRIATLEGPDAVAFAHAQFANDVTALPVGHWQWNAWLTPKGRVIALFALARPDEHRLLAVLPDYPADAFASALQKFVFRRKLKITDRPDLHVSGAFAASTHANGSRLGDIEGDLAFDLGGGGIARHWRVGPVAAPASDEANDDWRAADMRLGVPRLPQAQWEQWTPQQLSLDRLQAYSIKKGCYPGQEIVARTHFLGKAKRGLRLLEADTALRAGANVENAGVAAGEIISVAHSSPALALAVMPLEGEMSSLSSDGVALREIALLSGLAR